MHALCLNFLLVLEGRKGGAGDRNDQVSSLGSGVTEAEWTKAQGIEWEDGCDEMCLAMSWQKCCMGGTMTMIPKFVVVLLGFESSLVSRACP